MTQTEYEQKKKECWEEFKQKSLTGDEVQWPLATRLFYIFCTAFDRAYALGKQEKDADTVIQGWVGRDATHNLFLYDTKPGRIDCYEAWDSTGFSLPLNNNLFPDLTWNDEPEPVEIIIKRKKK